MTLSERMCTDFSYDSALRKPRIAHRRPLFVAAIQKKERCKFEQQQHQQQAPDRRQALALLASAAAAAAAAPAQAVIKGYEPMPALKGKDYGKPRFQ